MNKGMKGIIFIISLFVISCSQVTRVKITSNPIKANVFVRSLGSSERKLLGQTPIDINSKVIKQKVNSNGFIIVEVEKENFYKKEVIMTDFTATDIETSFQLNPLPKVEQGFKVDEMVSKFFSCQKLVRAKKYSQCQQILNKLKGKYPEVSTIYEFEGSVHYLKNENAKALDSFVTALKYNPNNEEAKRMIGIIRKSN